MEIIPKYFTQLTPLQLERFSKLYDLYSHWNQKINVISRQDIFELYTRHVLHSLGIAKITEFAPQSKILDVGTGGGFPGIPLAIMFPEAQFHLIDVIGKKIKVVQEIAKVLNLNNVKATQIRAQIVPDAYDFVVSRAVTNMTDFVPLVSHCIAKKQINSLKNGILYLKGGDLTQELKNFPTTQLYPLAAHFQEDFFETKQVVYLPLT